MSLPLLLAGPILRRVEPTLVSVWVAVSQPLHVQIMLWDGLVKDDGLGLMSEDGTERLFHAAEPPMLTSGAQPIADSASTIRIGDHLHVAVVSFKLHSANALLSDRPYSYNVVFRSQAGGMAKGDLLALKLLANEPIEGKPNVALGYEPGFLPSFELPPAKLTDLRVLHGSCRRINRLMEDGLAWVDDLIHDGRLGLPDPSDPTKPQKRPHQLLLTGDQIYADDVPLPLLPQLIERGRELLGNNEFLPTREPNATKPTYWPADSQHFPPALRHQLIMTEVRFTTVDTHSHLISFGEFAAMYLFIFSNTLWDLNALKRFDDIIGAISAPPENWGAVFKRLKQTPEEQIDNVLLKDSLDLLFKTISKDELRNALKARDIHGPNPDRTPLDPDNLTPEKLAGMSVDDRNKFKKIYDFADALSPEILLKFKTFFQDLQGDLAVLYETAKSKRREEVEDFFNALPKVRRALANVPTYMMFDDHDVTDDWNLNPIWRDRVYTSPLGRTVVRNGLLAYALFQGWGNDPVKFENGKHAELLQLATQLFPSGNSIAPQEEPEAANGINLLFGLDGEDPPIKWHYSYTGPKHMLLAMDNRTRRSFVSRIGPPGNASLKALEEQIPPGPLLAGVEVVLVVASLPVIGPPLFDEVIAPLSYRVKDLINYTLHGNERLKSMPGTDPDAIEAWAFDPRTFEALLKRLEPYRRVVFLSGDVHYGAGQFLSYWKKDDEQPARFAQFNSSGLRNVMPTYIRFADRSFPLAQRVIRANIGVTRLGWDQSAPAPVTLPGNNENVPPVFRAKLQQSPVMLPAGGWPEGTSEAKPPDWAWRAHVVVDDRPDANSAASFPGSRPLLASPAPLPSDTDASTLDGYRQLAARHVKQIQRMQHGRQILFANNLGLIKFDIKQNADGTTLDVIQELYAVHTNQTKAEVYTLHRVTLAALTGAKLAEKRPKIGDS